MADIPYGKIDFEAEALRIYDGNERERLFSEAYERFPGYQDAQMIDALDYTIDGFEESFASKYSEADWPDMTDGPILRSRRSDVQCGKQTVSRSRTWFRSCRARLAAPRAAACPRAHPTISVRR
jgi:hypothetical protein